MEDSATTVLQSARLPSSSSFRHVAFSEATTNSGGLSEVGLSWFAGILGPDLPRSMFEIFSLSLLESLVMQIHDVPPDVGNERANITEIRSLRTPTSQYKRSVMETHAILLQLARNPSYGVQLQIFDKQLHPS